MTSSAGTRLRSKIGFALPAITVVAEQMWSSPHVRELYPEYLCTMHTIVRSSVPLMETTLELARLLPNDPVACGVADYLAGHVDEERGHDVWVLEDLEATGRDPQEPLHRVPSPRVASLVGSQYYWVRHHHPLALLGHIAVVEGYPPSPELAVRLAESTGYPPEAFRSLVRHSMLDVHHRNELFAAIDGLPLEPEHESLLGISALHTVHQIAEVFAEVVARAPVPEPVEASAC